MTRSGGPSAGLDCDSNLKFKARSTAAASITGLSKPRRRRRAAARRAPSPGPVTRQGNRARRQWPARRRTATAGPGRITAA